MNFPLNLVAEQDESGRWIIKPVNQPHVAYTTDLIEPDEEEAYANLFAAAPALYAVLKTIVETDVVMRFDAPGAFKYLGAIECARMALAKARGETK